MSAEQGEANPQARWAGTLPGMFGLEFTGAAEGRMTSRMAVRPEFLAPNGYLHAASVIALADTTCGAGTMQNRPEGAQGFTTIELKCNYLGTVREGRSAARRRWSMAVSRRRSGMRASLTR